MATLEIPKFYPTQVKFLNSKARYTLFGGAKAGGKSFSARYLAILLALKYEGIKVLIIRRTFGELYGNFVVPMRKILNVYDEVKENRVAEYKTVSKEFIFPNGSRILLGMADNEKEVGKHQGQSYDVIIFDEATLIPEQFHEDIIISNRLSGNIPTHYGFEPRAYYTANPGGIGHQWVKAMFIDNPDCNEEGSDYVFIPSLVYDNEFYMKNDPDYVKKLEALPEKKRKALLYGDWNAFEGQFFEEWDETKHVIDPFPIPANWRIYRTRDYGFDMLAGYWIALDEKGNGYVFKEVYKDNLIASAAGNLMNEYTREKIYLDIAPPDLWSRSKDSGKSPADIFVEECGHYLTKADNKRENGWLMMREWLADVEEEVIEADGTPKKISHPKLRFFKTCKNVIRTIPLLVYNPKNPNDCLTEPHEITHAPDAIRYFCTSWSFAPNYIPPLKTESWIEKAIRNKNKNNVKGEYMVW